MIFIDFSFLVSPSGNGELFVLYTAAAVVFSVRTLFLPPLGIKDYSSIPEGNLVYTLIIISNCSSSSYTCPASSTVMVWKTKSGTSLKSWVTV